MDWNFPYPTQPHCKLVINALFSASYASWATGKKILLKQPSAWKSCWVEPPLKKLPVANFTNVLTIGFPVPSSKWKKKNTLLVLATFLQSSWSCHSPRGGATPLKRGKIWFLGSKSGTSWGVSNLNGIF